MTTVWFKAINRIYDKSMTTVGDMTVNVYCMRHELSFEVIFIELTFGCKLAYILEAITLLLQPFDIYIL